MKTLFSFFNEHRRITLGALSLLVLIFVGIILFGRPNPVTIGVWRIEGTTDQGLRAEILKGAVNTKQPPRFVELDADQVPTDKILRKYNIDLLILEASEAFRTLADSGTTVEPLVLQSVPSSARARVTVDTYLRALPLLANHYQLAAHRRILLDAGQPFPANLRKLEDSARVLKKNLQFPILAAGGYDRHLGMFLAALLEARSGLDGWQAAVTAMQVEQDPDTAVTHPAFDDIITILRGWQKEGLLHTEWLHIKAPDLVNFIENRQAGFVFMDLETHRLVDHRTIDMYETSFISADAQLSSRSLVIPLIVAMPVSTGRNEQDAALILEHLASDQSQSNLSNATGFAPVSGTATPPDRQSSDVRFWLAASERPLTCLFATATADPEKQKALATAIRARLRE